MVTVKNALSATAIAALMAMGALVITAAPAAARMVCNAEGDCWHTDAPPPRVPGITFSLHPDDWYFHQTWDNNSNRHYRDYHAGRGYYKGGVWITL
jgi:hypothetical protein